MILASWTQEREGHDAWAKSGAETGVDTVVVKTETEAGVSVDE